jgi:gluconate 2-dehydrogenase gamma chain
MRPIDRRDALKALGAPALAPLVSSFHPDVPPREAGWMPRLLTPDEVEATAQLAERIVPETGTPGARRALVHQYIDWVLAEGEPARRESFRAGLAWLDRRCRELHGASFAELGPSRQDELLARLDGAGPEQDAVGRVFFALAKQLTVDGYYRSEAGLRQELGFRGRTFLAEFEGCTHAEHHAFEVEK